MIRRRHVSAWIVNSVTILLCAIPIVGQSGEVTVAAADAEAFRLGALRASERYRMPAQATLDGYRSVGPEFPGMGVHWLHISTLISGTLDPDRPALLGYIEIDGSPTLVNVAYGTALLSGQEPPTVNGLPPDPWHEHYGTVEEEMLRPHGQADHGVGGAQERGAAVVMFHVWATPNQNGPFNQHNWALSFLRAGLAVPDEPSEFAARFVGLGTETGFRYQLEIVEFLFPAKWVDEARSEILDAAEEAARWIGAERGGEAADPTELLQLEASWRALGVTLLELAPTGEIAATVVRLHGV
jgi:hypothetical protein